MKNLLTLLVLAALACGAYFVYNSAAQERFLLSGTVTVANSMLKQAQAANNTCYIIVKNEADVPIAFKRVINPQFPLQFKITKADLLVGDITGKVKVEVEINNHGNVGVLKEGDIFGAAQGAFEPSSGGILVSADKRTGMPKFAGSTRGDFFRTAAR